MKPLIMKLVIMLVTLVPPTYRDVGNRANVAIWALVMNSSPAKASTVFARDCGDLRNEFKSHV